MWNDPISFCNIFTLEQVINKTEHFGAHFQPNIKSNGLHLELQKKLKFSPRTHLFKFLYDKRFTGHSFGAELELQVDKFKFSSKLFVLCIIKYVLLKSGK